MLAERTRVLRVLVDRSLWPLLVGRLLDQAAGWLLLLYLLLAAWTQTRDPQVVAWVLAARLLPRFLGSTLPTLPRLTGSRFVVPLLLTAEAAVAFFVTLVMWFPPRVIGNLGVPMVIGALTIGILASLAGGLQRAHLSSLVDRRQSGAGAMLMAAIDRAGLVLGAVAAALLVLVQVPTITAPVFVAGAFATAAAAFLASLAFGRRRATRIHTARAASDPPPARLDRRCLLPFTAAFGTGALATALLATLFTTFAQAEAPSPVPLVLAAVVGAGMLLGPLPVPRFLLRVSAPLLTVATAMVAAVSAGAAVLSGNVLVAVPSLFILGMAAVTQDSIRAISLRRLIPAVRYARSVRIGALALAAGQIVGAIAIALGSAALSPAGVVVAVASAQVILVVLAMGIVGLRDSLEIGGLSTLPVRSVTHRLSWDTSPAAMAADLGATGPRVHRLARWVEKQATPEQLRVTLPVSGREYEIYRPNERAREGLFEAGRADPDKQMPYWAKVWPSGVALADVVVERSGDVTDRHVLELGAGLGVTACAVLEHGGHLVTADYSALPLAYCRLNALINTRTAPRATCFNWRHDSEVTAALGQPDFRAGFPLIIAGDVLYEGRDAEPLLNVIERLLTADGSLWLAEPVRRTAQRFLDSAAALGWDIDSRQVRAQWPDATGGPVNVHFLRRSADADRIIGDLGGWRI